MGVVTDLLGLIEHVEHFRKRVVQDAVAEATARYWHTRADQLQAALDRPGDCTGRATPEDLADRRQRLTESIKACRNRAFISLIGGDQ